MKMLRFFSLMLVLMLQAVPVPAGDMDIDPVHSSINFKVRHIVGAVLGGFNDFRGRVDFDPEKPDQGSIRLVILAKSIDTGVPDRDRHLRSEDFFDVEHYPSIEFSSRAIERVAEDRYVAEGDLTLRGVTKSVEIPFTWLGSREHPVEKCVKVSGMESVFKLNRLDYGVGTGQFEDMGLVGRDAVLFVTLELQEEMPGCGR